MNAELITQQEQQTGPGLSDYVNVIRRRIWQVLIPFLGLAAVGLGVAFLIPKEYKGMTELEVIDPDAGVASVFTQVGYSVPHKHLLTTIPQDVRQVDFLSPIVEKYGITEGYNLSVQRERNRLFERMRKKLEVTAILVKSGTDLVNFEYTGRDSPRVTEFINEVRRKWQDQFSERYAAAIKGVENHIRKIYDDALTSFTEAQAKYREFQDANGTDYFGKDPGNSARNRLELLTQQKETFELQLKENESVLRTVTEQLKAVRPTDKVDVSKKRSPEWSKQNAVVETVQAEIRKLELDYTDEWPKLKTARIQLEEEKAKLAKIEEFQTDSYVQTVPPQYLKLTTDQSNAQTAINSLREKIEKTQRTITALEAEVKLIPEKSARAAVLRDAVDSASVQLDKALKMREIARVTRDRVTANQKRFFKVTMEFTPEEAKAFDPVWPNYALFAGIGAFVGLLLGGAIAFIGEFTSSAFTTPNQVRYMLQVPVLGEIAPLYTVGQQKSRRRKRWVILFVLVLVGIALLIVHVMWFDKERWRANLPMAVRDIMKRIYGGR